MLNFNWQFKLKTNENNHINDNIDYAWCEGLIETYNYGGYFPEGATVNSLGYNNNDDDIALEVKGTEDTGLMTEFFIVYTSFN